MTCEIKAGEGWGENTGSTILHHKGKVLSAELGEVFVRTGGVNDGTVVWADAHLNFSMVGKVKTWCSPVDNRIGFGIYGNGASVSFSSPDYSCHLAITNLPKKEIKSV